MADSPTTHSSYDGRRQLKPSHLQLQLIERGAQELADLMKLKQQGWDDEHLDKHFEQQRNQAQNPGHELKISWYRKMTEIMNEIDGKTNCIPFSGDLHFLDLGCSPGGFSAYVLTKNYRARGLGISLEEEKGGHRYLLQSKRHELISANLTYFQLGPTPILDTDKLQPLPNSFGSEIFDLCILDAHQLRWQKDGENWDGWRLAISQIILALMGIKRGGTLIMKLSRPDHLYSARILWMLDQVSTELQTCKPLTMHRKRGSFYAVALGVGLGKAGHDLPSFVHAFQKLWVELTFGGEDGRGRWMTEEDLDFLILEEELALSFADRLIQLGRPVWSIQAQALAKLVDNSKRKKASI